MIQELLAVYIPVPRVNILKKEFFRVPAKIVIKAMQKVEEEMTR